MALQLSQGFRNITYFFQNSEVSDVILPFLLIFTIIFTVFEKVQLFGQGKKNISIMLSLIISFLTIIPHITGRYPPNYNPVTIINSLVPGAAVLAVVIVLIIFLLGIFGSHFLTDKAPGWAIVIIFGILLYIFGTTVGWWTSPNSFFSSSWDSDLSMTIVALGILGIVVLFITGPQQHQPLDKVMNWLGGRH